MKFEIFYKWLLMIGSMILLSGMFLTGCQQEIPSIAPPPIDQAVLKLQEKQVEDLSTLLPSEVGHTWHYNGFAEYGHDMTLNEIQANKTQPKRVYSISGKVADLSDGESKADFDIILEYVIENNSLIQKKVESVMMDSKFDTLTLIKTPLEVGTTWSENVTDKLGNTTTLESEIIKIEIMPDGSKAYSIHYKDENSDYDERRQIIEGKGIVSFEKLFELGEEPFTAGYALFVPEVYKGVEVTLYFPDDQAEKLWAEKRIVDVENAAVAKASIQALIDGPRESGHFSAMPKGTTVIGLKIEEGICTVDFSREFLDNHSGGSAGEMMTLGSLVNTLTQFPTIQKVRILVEGKSGETLGNILLDKPLIRMDDLIGIKK